MTSSVRVYPQKQVIFSWFILNNAIKIGRLERTVKYDFLIEVQSWIHTLKCPVIETSFVEMICPQPFLSLNETYTLMKKELAIRFTSIEYLLILRLGAPPQSGDNSEKEHFLCNV